MSLLLASDFSEKHLDFQALLESAHEPTYIRYFAAIQLGKMNTPAALKILHKNCRLQDQQVLAGVMKALGRIGSKKTLEIITSVKSNAKGLAETQANFAAALIAHRYGLPGNEIPVPGDPDLLPLTAAGVNTFQITPSTKEETKLCVESVKQDLYGIEIDESRTYSIHCKRRTWMMLFNREFSSDNIVKKLTAGKFF